MILIDRLLMGGIRFVLDTLGTAADAERNDASQLHTRLLEAQMQLELGEITEEEFLQVEADVSARLRELRERERAQAGVQDVRVVGAEITVDEALDER